MTEFTLNDNTWLWPTPAGAYYAVQQSDPEKPRALIQKLLTLDQAPHVDTQTIAETWPEFELDDYLELLYLMQTLKYLTARDEAISAPQGVVEDIVSEAIQALSMDGKALLADNQGFHIATCGFPHETAGELAALAAQLGEVYQRRRGVLHRNLGLDTAAMALVDASGFSQLGFWPMFIGKTCFYLVIEGFPKLNQEHFTHLVWMLSRRYGTGPGQDDNAPEGT